MGILDEDDLLPDRLEALWHAVQQKQLSVEACADRERRLLGEYQAIWARALMLDGRANLEESLLAELGTYYGCTDLDAVRGRCRDTRARIAEAWRKNVDADDRGSVDAFYDRCEVDLYTHALMWWHTLSEDNSPLAYVSALHFARRHGCRVCLDFGTGVGSGGLLFARHGMETLVADISAPMLQFAKWRFDRRGLPGQFLDLKVARLSPSSVDFICAMDVFEHLSDPLGTVEELARALTPGGVLFGRFAVEADEDHPLHIVRDFGPVFARLADLGLTEVWRDRWLWGHQAFRKGAGSS
jgi:SAM-dependent methyltransferase